MRAAGILEELKMNTALKNLGMDLPLAAGYVATVEPRLYFIPSILKDRCVCLGGVRIEDTCH